MSEIVTIHTFDDGRGDFKKYINEWIITKLKFHQSHLGKPEQLKIWDLIKLN